MFCFLVLSHFLDVCFFDRLNSVLANRIFQCLGKPPGCCCWPMLTGILSDSSMLGIVMYGSHFFCPLLLLAYCATCTCLLASDIPLGCRTSDRGPLRFAGSSRRLTYRRMDMIVAQLDYSTCEARQACGDQGRNFRIIKINF